MQCHLYTLEDWQVGIVLEPVQTEVGIGVAVAFTMSL